MMTHARFRNFKSLADVEIGRSRPSEGALSTTPSAAIVVEPPPSSAIALTAPSRARVWASSRTEGTRSPATSAPLATANVICRAIWSKMARPLAGSM